MARESWERYVGGSDLANLRGQRETLRSTLGSEQVQAVVAPGLRREGIVIHVPHQKPSNWRTILTENHISDKILHEAGFVLFKDFRPSDDSECLDWPIVRGDNKIQMLHRDHPRHHGVAFFMRRKRHLFLVNLSPF